MPENLSPRQKWDRLNNPKSLEDYGLSMSREELLQVPEGAMIVEAVDETRRGCAELEGFMVALGNSMRNTMDDIILSAVKGYKCLKI